MEKIKTPVSGFIILLLSLILLGLAIYLVIYALNYGPEAFLGWAALSAFVSIFLAFGIIVVNPNHSKVLTFFGKYVGTVKENGLLFVNPLFKKQKIITT